MSNMWQNTESRLVAKLRLQTCCKMKKSDNQRSWNVKHVAKYKIETCCQIKTSDMLQSEKV